jgi:hypothetical protein
MSDTATKKPNRFAKLFRPSMPARIALMSVIGLLLLTIVTWQAYARNPQHVRWNDYLHWTSLLAVSLMLLAIGVLVYWTVRLWYEELPTSDDALQRAWNAGLEAIEKHGWDIQRFPLFLILGCKDVEAQRHLLQQSGCRLLQEQIPSAPSPIHWFLAEDRIYLACRDIGVFAESVNRLAIHWRNHALGADLATNVSLQQQLVDETSIEEEFVSDQRLATGHGQFKTRNKTIGSDDAIATQTATLAPVASSPRESTSTKQILARLDAAESLLDDAYAETALNDDQAASTPELMSSTEQLQLQMQLGEVCRKLRNVRGPVVPINGVMVWIDAPKQLECSQWSHACGQALRNDLSIIETELGSTSPTTIMLDRMHAVPGFRELIRRIGREKSAHGLLGGSQPLEHESTHEALSSLAQRTTRALIMNSYALMSGQGLSQPGNHDLFTLITSARGKLTVALHGLLGECAVDSRKFSGRSDRSRSSPSTLFSGVYFAACGESPIEQGFSKAIFDRQVTQHEYVTWNEATLDRDRKLNQCAWMLKALSLILASLLIVQFLYAMRS